MSHGGILSISFETWFLIGLELSNSTRLDGKWVARVLLCLPSWCWNYQHAPPHPAFSQSSRCQLRPHAWKVNTTNPGNPSTPTIQILRHSKSISLGCLILSIVAGYVFFFSSEDPHYSKHLVFIKFLSIMGWSASTTISRVVPPTNWLDLNPSASPLISSSHKLNSIAEVSRLFLSHHPQYPAAHTPLPGYSKILECMMLALPFVLTLFP